MSSCVLLTGPRCLMWSGSRCSLLLKASSPPILRWSLSNYSTSGVLMTKWEQSNHRDYRLRFRILRDPPLGPQKLLAPLQLDPLTGHRGETGEYRRIVHYPKDGEYTIRPLQTTKLGGRDPITGRKVIQRWGGGRKQNFRWVDHRRIPSHIDPPHNSEQRVGEEPKEYVEKVLAICYDPCRESQLALTGSGDHLRWQLATVNMTQGQLIKTSWDQETSVPEPKEGDSYPLKVLPINTIVSQVQRWVGAGDDKGEMLFTRAHSFARIVRHEEEEKRTVVIVSEEKARKKNNPGKAKMFSLDWKVQCVIGKVSKHPLKQMVVGSPNRSRWMGNRPSSGLWHRKTGFAGRKPKENPPFEMVLSPEEKENPLRILMHAITEGTRGRLPGKKRRVIKNYWRPGFGWAFRQQYWEGREKYLEQQNMKPAINPKSKAHIV